VDVVKTDRRRTGRSSFSWSAANDARLLPAQLRHLHMGGAIGN